MTFQNLCNLCSLSFPKSSPFRRAVCAYCLHNKATSAVCHDNNVGERFRTTTGVRQRCLLSPTLFNIFLDRIMADSFEDHDRTVSIGGRTITNLRFANDIDGLARQGQELVKLVNHLEEASTAYGMQISAEKTQLMTKNANGISTDITIDNKKQSIALNIWEA